MIMTSPTITSSGFLQFQNFYECFVYLLNLIETVGIDNTFGEKQVYCVAYRVENGEIPKDLIDSLGIPFEWLESELSERLSGKALNPGRAWKKWTEVYKSRMHAGKFSYTNAERIHYQLKHVVSLLSSDPFSRRAIISIWDPNIDSCSKLEVPSTLTGQFYRDGHVLHAIYVSRSNNCLRFLPADFYMYSGIQRWIAQELGLVPGSISHLIGTLYNSKENLDQQEIKKRILNLAK